MSQNVTRLKELLFDRETATLAELQQRIAEVATGEKASREAQGKSLETALADEAARRALLAQQVEKLMARAGTQEEFRASVADALAELVDELPRVGRMSFRRLTSGLVERLEVIVRFLALLELFKQGLVELDQTERFGDIDVVWTGGEGGLDDLEIDDYEG